METKVKDTANAGQRGSIQTVNDLNVWFGIAQRDASFELTQNEGTDKSGAHKFIAVDPVARNRFYNNGMYYGSASASPPTTPHPYGCRSISQNTAS
ncbi:MAG: hypothetical protein LUE10_05435 [Alistipes sp.]|nr:hypothetical protein [Alistipes sp.]